VKLYRPRHCCSRLACADHESAAGWQLGQYVVQMQGHDLKRIGSSNRRLEAAKQEFTGVVLNHTQL
jgi:hypothetical protein